MSVLEHRQEKRHACRFCFSVQLVNWGALGTIIYGHFQSSGVSAGTLLYGNGYNRQERHACRSCLGEFMNDIRAYRDIEFGDERRYVNEHNVSVMYSRKDDVN